MINVSGGLEYVLQNVKPKVILDDWQCGDTAAGKDRNKAHNMTKIMNCTENIVICHAGR